MLAVRLGSYSIENDLARDAVLVPLEVDGAVAALVATTLVPAGDVAIAVAAARALHRAREALLGHVVRDLREVGDRHESPRR